jgi:hypothetical protein
VSVGSKKHVWGVDSKDCIYKWKKGTWQVRAENEQPLQSDRNDAHVGLCAQRVTMADVPQHISVASDGSIVAMDKDTNGVVNVKKLVMPVEDKEGEMH